MLFKRTKNGVTVGGIEYSADVTALFLFWMATTFFQGPVGKLIPGSWLAGPVVIMLALGLILSLLLHEAGHAYTAIHYGITIKGIKIFMLGGMAMMGSRIRAASHEFWVAIAGPLVSVALWLIFSLPLMLGADAIWAKLLAKLGFYNLVIAIFNMVPAFPTDGGRVFRSMVWGFTKNFVLSTRIAVRVGEVIAVLYSLYAIWAEGFGSIWALLLSAFIIFAGEMELRHAIKEAENGASEE